MPRTVSAWKKKRCSPFLSKFLWIKCSHSVLILKALPTAAILTVTCIFWNITSRVSYPPTGETGEEGGLLPHLQQLEATFSHNKPFWVSTKSVVSHLETWLTWRIQTKELSHYANLTSEKMIHVQLTFHMLHLCNVSIMVQEKIIVSHLKWAVYLRSCLD